MTEHVATYRPSANVPNLVQTFCSCGMSSYGSVVRESAEQDHAEHAVNPDNGSYRGVPATNVLLGYVGAN